MIRIGARRACFASFGHTKITLRSSSVSNGIHAYSTSRIIQSKCNLTESNDNIIRSKVNLEIPSLSLYTLLKTRFLLFQDKIALTDGVSGRQYTYRELDDHVQRFGASLLKYGMKERDVVGILSYNRPEFAIAVLGILGLNATTTTINPSYVVDEIVYQLKDSKAKALVVEPSLLSNASKAAEAVGIKTIFLLGQGEPEICSSRSVTTEVVTWNDIMKENVKHLCSDPQPKSLDGTIILPYSSGTTGRSKGVMLTDRNLVSNIQQMSYLSKEIVVDRALGLLPFYHIYGLVVSLLHNLYEGSQIITLPKFEPESYLETVTTFQIQRINLVPPLLIFSTKHPLVDKFDLSCVKEFTTAAAPCAANLFRSMREKFAASFVRQGYGMTETSPVAIVHTTYDTKDGSTGIPVPNSEAKVADLYTGQALGVNQIGEVCIRGSHVMKGYLNNPEATSQTVTQDGWLHTGDIGYYDEDHHFFIVDRLKELIKYKGFQVPPAEIEDVLLMHPAVNEAAVVGMKDSKAGEIPRAFIVPKYDVSKEELIEFVGSRVANHKQLRGGVEFIDEMPKAPSGKLLRRLLRDS